MELAEGTLNNTTEHVSYYYVINRLCSQHQVTVHCPRRQRLVMDEFTVEDEKKPFEVEGQNDEDTQPDPDEELMLDKGNGRVWLVKVSLLR